MKVEVEAVDGSVTTLEKITELSFSQSSDAACDSLYVYFKAERELGEIVAVRAYDGKKKIFNGLCDCQRTSIGNYKPGKIALDFKQVCLLIIRQSRIHTVLRRQSSYA